MSNKTKIIIASLIVFLAAASRLINHPYNFTPIVAMSIFAGCHLHRRWGVLVPLGAMLVSDYFIGFYDWQVMTSVYFSIVLAFGIGWLLKKNFKWYNAVFASLISSVVFFIITNFAVWRPVLHLPFLRAL
jgi:membrane protease YdiL (CAAX protease family)